MIAYFEQVWPLMSIGDVGASMITLGICCIPLALLGMLMLALADREYGAALGIAIALFVMTAFSLMALDMNRDMLDRKIRHHQQCLAGEKIWCKP